MNSLFDPESFMSQEVSGANDTKFPTIPAGDWPAIINKVTAKQQPDRHDPAKVYTIVDILYGIDDAGVREATKLEKPSVRQSIFLDLNEEGQLDMSEAKNVSLGKLRAALGLNDPDKPFSFGQLQGQACMVTVKHRPNPDDPEAPYSDVKSVAKL